MKHSNFPLLLATTTILLLSFIFIPISFAGNERGSSHGQPFRTLGDLQITELTASLQVQIANIINQIIEISECRNDPSILEILRLLRDTACSLQDQLNALKGSPDLPCDLGVDVNKIINSCGGGGGSAPSRTQVTRTVSVFQNQYGYVNSTCPSGYIVTGCGYTAKPFPLVQAVEVHSISSFTCISVGFGSFGSGTISSIAECTIPPPVPFP